MLGHAQGGRADIGLHADVEPEHLTFDLVESFHGGAGWRLTVSGSREVSLVAAQGAGPAPQGTRLAPGARAALVDGTRIVLAPKLACVFQRPDPASASARLLLEHGHEAGGAPRVLLFAPGGAGRVLVSAARAAHVHVAGLTAEVELVATDRADGLTVRCTGGVALVSGAARPERPERLERLATAPTDTAALQSVTVDVPPDARVVLAVGARAAPPFQVALAPPGA